jgi:dATP pyrophosphohydrolase
LFRRPDSVLVVVYTGDGQVLRLRRREPKDFWQSVTGSLSEYETPFKAAQREVREETGLVADAGLADAAIVNRYPIHPAWRHKYAAEVRENTEHVFSLLLPEICSITLDPEEHLEYRWLLREQAAELAGSATDSAAILGLVPAVSAEA